MPQGPLGGPRPTAGAIMEITFQYDRKANLIKDDLEKAVDKVLSASSDAYVEERQQGTRAMVVINQSRMRLEELERLTEVMSKELSFNSMTGKIIISSKVVGRVMKAPRPIAEGSVNFIFTLENPRDPPVEELVESELRRKEWGMDHLEVTVNEMGPADVYSITVITREKDVAARRMESIKDTIEGIVGTSFANRNVEISVT